MQPSDQKSDIPDRPEDTNGYNPHVTRRVISPVSSEEDIRQELLNTAEASPQKPSENNEYTPNPQLVAPVVTPRPLSPTASSSPVPKNRIKKRHLVSTTLAVIFLAVLITGAYVYFSRKVSVNDLVAEDTGNSSYLRPKQWRKVNVNLSSFGDMKGGKGKSTAIVSMSEGGNIPALARASDAIYEQLRQQLTVQMEQAMPQANTSSFKGVCKSEIKFSTEPDKTKTDTTVGLVAMTGVCDSTFGTYKVIIRVVGGNDGKVRYLIVGATEAGWRQNKEAYQAMLQSVRVSANVSI